jgi:hypothetical protein
MRVIKLMSADTDLKGYKEIIQYIYGNNPDKYGS